MQSHSVELAERILLLLKGEDFHDATSALKIAKVLLPIPAYQPKREAPLTRGVSHAASQ